MYVVSHCSAIGNGEESIPMLMFNHSEKEDSITRNRPQSNVDKSPPRLVEIAVSNPGTPIKVVEIKSSTASLIPTGWYPPILTYSRSYLFVTLSVKSSLILNGNETFFGRACHIYFFSLSHFQHSTKR